MKTITNNHNPNCLYILDMKGYQVHHCCIAAFMLSPLLHCSLHTLYTSLRWTTHVCNRSRHQLAPAQVMLAYGIPIVSTTQFPLAHSELGTNQQASLLHRCMSIEHIRIYSHLNLATLYSTLYYSHLPTAARQSPMC